MILISQIFYIYVVITMQDGWANQIPLSDKEYAKMPPIGGLEDYGRCLLEPDDMYCHLQFMLDSKEPSPLLDLMKNVSLNSLRRYNHLKINRGICVSRSCAKYIRNSPIQKHDEQSFKSIIQTCVNESMWQKYRLEAYLINVKHCETTQDLDAKELTLGQILVAVAVILIVAMNLIGSYYASYVKKHNISPANKIWMAFSIQENTKLVLFGSEKETENFGSLLGMRCIAIAGEIFLHTTLISSVNVENEKFYEDLYGDKIRSTLMNFGILIDLFFVSSGFLLGYNYLNSPSKNKFTVRYFFKSIFNRFLRMTPTWALTLALICTWTLTLGSGPMWHELVVAESLNCRENWWKSLLHIANLFEYDYDHCMLHMWFSAANMQVYLFSLILIMIIVRYPKLTWVMFISTVTIFLAIPSIIIYRKELFPVVIYSPELRRSLLRDANPFFTNVYVTSYGHASAGIIGLIAGYFHYQIKQRGIDIRTWKVFNILYKNSLIAILLIVISGTYFYQENYVYDAFIAAVYSSVYRLTLSAFFAILILGAVNRCGRKMRGVLEFKPFQIMGRLSFCAYLVHMIPLRQYYGMNTAPYYTSYFRILIVSLGSSIVTFISAYILTIFVEYPVNELRLAFTTPPSNKVKEAKTK